MTLGEICEIISKIARKKKRTAANVDVNERNCNTEQLSGCAGRPVMVTSRCPYKLAAHLFAVNRLHIVQALVQLLSLLLSLQLLLTPA